MLMALLTTFLRLSFSLSFFLLLGAEGINLNKFCALFYKNEDKGQHKKNNKCEIVKISLSCNMIFFISLQCFILVYDVLSVL